MEKVIRTFSGSISEETISVQINGPTTDIISNIVISDVESGDVLSNQTLRKTMPTSEARDIVNAAVKAG
jgi:ribosome maturation protein Sdo1